MHRLPAVKSVTLLAAVAAMLTLTEAGWVLGETLEIDDSPLEVDQTLLVKLLLISACTGFLAAIMGLGGGVIIVPVLTSFLGFSIREAIAVSIIEVVATSVSGGLAYVKQRMANIRLTMFLQTSTTLGALTGALLALAAPKPFLYLMFSAFAFYVALFQVYSVKREVRMMRLSGFKKMPPDRASRFFRLSGAYFDEGEKLNVEYSVMRSFSGWLVSFLAGIEAGMLGIGGGFINVSTMNLFMNVPIKAAIATSKLMITATAATSAVVYYLTGAVRLNLVAPVVVGTTIGASAGARVMNRLRVKWLKLALATLIFYLGYTMLRKGLTLTIGINLP